MDCALAFARFAELMPEARARFRFAISPSSAQWHVVTSRKASDFDVLVDFIGTATFDGSMALKLFLDDSLGVKVDPVTRVSIKHRLCARIEAALRSRVRWANEHTADSMRPASALTAGPPKWRRPSALRSRLGSSAIPSRVFAGCASFDP
jgi:hypothetical protein